GRSAVRGRTGRTEGLCETLARVPLAGRRRGFISLRRTARFADAPDRRHQKHELRLGRVGESARALVSWIERTENECCREGFHPHHDWSVGAELRRDEGAQ